MDLNMWLPKPNDSIIFYKIIVSIFSSINIIDNSFTQTFINTIERDEFHFKKNSVYVWFYQTIQATEHEDAHTFEIKDNL